MIEYQVVLKFVNEEERNTRSFGCGKFDIYIYISIALAHCWKCWCSIICDGLAKPNIFLIKHPYCC